MGDFLKHKGTYKIEKEKPYFATHLKEDFIF